ncbi:hypothetical protein [Halosimplex salinum]
MRDLWTDEERTTSGEIAATVGGHEVAFLRISPV